MENNKEKLNIMSQIENSEEEVETNPVINQAYADVITFYNPYFAEVLSQIPDIYISSILSNKYAIIHVPTDDIYSYVTNDLASVMWEVPILCGLLDRESMEASGITAVQNQPFLNLTGQGVLIGIIDTGIDYTMDTFIYEDGSSKIAYLWDQSIDGSHPAEFPYGAEYGRETINEALQSINPRGIVPSVDEVGHGTFLASLAAGRENSGVAGAAPNADLIVVKLKQAKRNLMEEYLINPDTPAYQSNDVMTGIEYIYYKALELGMPVAICIGVGSNDGAHDGFSFFERYISEMGVVNRMSFILAVGNEGNMAHHLAGQLIQGGGPYTIELRIGQNEPGFIMNLWALSPDRVSVSITSPIGGVVQRIQPSSGEHQEARFVLEQTEIDIRYVFPSLRNGDQLVYIRFRDPTPGLWEITVYGDLILDGRFHAWLPISAFLSSDTAFLSSSAQNTVVLPATANGIISVGAYNANDNSIYIASSRGPSVRGVQAPDLCAPGVNVGGVYPNNTQGIMSGTSVAAAITTGAAALILEWAIIRGNDPLMNTLKMRTYLIQGCTQRAGIIYPDDLWGYGTLNLIQSFERINPTR